MEAYTGFASVYDLFMDDIPYEEWCSYLTCLLNKYGVDKGLVLELGCGTGTVTELLAAQGYDMIGVDASNEMLEVAMEKRVESGHDILYLMQDMREFELYGTVKAVVSICDSINYILDFNDLITVFSLVNNYLDPNGIFIFDLKTEHYYKDIMGERIFGDNREEGSFIWDNYYYEEEHINEYALTIFQKTKNGLYKKFEETHLQRAYSIDEIKEALEKAGMEFVTAYDAFTEASPTQESTRIYIVAREQGK